MPDRVDPLVGFKYGIEIEGTVKGWFIECGGLTVERKTEPWREGGVNDYVLYLPGRVEQTNITLRHGVADNELWDWFQKGLYDGKVERRNVSIILYNNDWTQAKRWNLSKAYPVKWTGPELKSDSNQAIVETLELVHQGMEMTGWTNV